MVKHLIFVVVSESPIVYINHQIYFEINEHFKAYWLRDASTV